MKILLIEEDLLLNEILSEFLTNLKYDVTSLYSKTLLEDVLSKENFDLLVYDVNIPQSTDLFLLKKTYKSKKTIPTIFLTSICCPDKLKDKFLLVANDYISKPFHLPELELLIQKKKLK